MATIERWTIAFVVVLLAAATPLVLAESPTANTPQNDPVNDTLWSRSLSSIEDGYTAGFVADVIVTSDGFLVVGKTEDQYGGSTGYLALLGKNGTLKWESTPRTFDNGGILAGTALGDGDYVLVGWKDDGFLDVGGDLFIARYGPNADMTWKHRDKIGGPSETLVDSGKLLDVVTTKSGDVLAVGHGMTNESRNTSFIGPRRGGFVFRFDRYGNIESYHELPKGVGGITPTPNGTEYVVTQKSITPERGPDVWRLNADGNRTAGWTFTPRGDYTAEPVTQNGTLYAVTNHGQLVSFDRHGTLKWRKNLSRNVSELAVGPNGTVILAVESHRSGTAAVEIQWYTQAGEPRAVGPAFDRVRELQRAGNRTLVVVGRRNGEPHVARIPLRPPDPEVTTSVRVLDNETNLVTLNASRSTAFTNITAYEWDLDGDGLVERTTTTPTVQHQYDQQGYPRVNVTVVSSAGIATTESVRVNITDTLPPVPKLSTPANGLVAAGAAATFNASASTDNLAIAKYRWDFDADGTVDQVTETPAVQRQYGGMNETHRLALTVVDRQNNTNTTTFTIKSVENDKPSVDIDSGLAVIGHETTLTAVVDDRVGTITAIQWYLPNGSTKATNGSRKIRYTFNGTANQSVQVVVYDEYGASATTNVTVDVRKRYPPDAGFVTGGPLVLLFVIAYFLLPVVVLALITVVLYKLYGQ